MQVAMKEYNVKFILFSEIPIVTSFYLFPYCDPLANTIAYKNSDHLVEEEQKYALSVKQEEKLLTFSNIKFTRGFINREFMHTKS